MKVDISLAHKVCLCRDFCRDTLLLLNLFDVHSKSIERKMHFQPLLSDLKTSVLLRATSVDAKKMIDSIFFSRLFCLLARVVGSWFSRCECWFYLKRR
jgi:hypothetical protein